MKAIYFYFSLNMAMEVAAAEVIKESEKITIINFPNLPVLRQQLCSAFKTSLSTVQLEPTDDSLDIKSTLLSAHISFVDVPKHVKVVKHLNEVALSQLFVDDVHTLRYIEEIELGEKFSTLLSPLSFVVSETLSASNASLVEDTTKARVILHKVVQCLMCRPSIAVKKCTLASNVNNPIQGGKFDIILGFKSNGPNNVVYIEDESNKRILVSPFLVEAKLQSDTRRYKPYVEQNCMCQGAVELLAFSEVLRVERTRPKPVIGIVGSDRHFVALIYLTKLDILFETIPVTYINHDGSLNIYGISLLFILINLEKFGLTNDYAGPLSDLPTSGWGTCTKGAGLYDNVGIKVEKSVREATECYAPVLVDIGNIKRKGKKRKLQNEDEN